MEAAKEYMKANKTISSALRKTMEIKIIITSDNTAVTQTASEILGKERRTKKPWATTDVLDFQDER